jgi:hypothetical protein
MPMVTEGVLPRRTKRTTVRTPDPAKPNAGGHSPPRTPAGFRDRPTGATFADAGGHSSYPDELPRGVPHRVKGRHSSTLPIPSPTLLARPGRATPGSWYVCVKGFGLVSSSGSDGQRLDRMRQPRCARLRRFRVDPPAPVHEAARTTRTRAD